MNKKLILQRRSPAKVPRQIAMYLCSLYSNSVFSLTDIGKLFSVSQSGLTRSRDRIKQKIENNDEEIITIIDELKKSIAGV